MNRGGIPKSASSQSEGTIGCSLQPAIGYVSVRTSLTIARARAQEMGNRPPTAASLKSSPPQPRAHRSVRVLSRIQTQAGPDVASEHSPEWQLHTRLRRWPFEALCESNTRSLTGTTTVDGAHPCRSVIFLVHAAIDGPIAMLGAMAPEQLPFMDMTNTTVIVIKVRSLRHPFISSYPRVERCRL